MSPLEPRRFFQIALVVPFVSSLAVAACFGAFSADAFLFIGIGFLVLGWPIYTFVAIFMHVMLTRATTAPQMVWIWALAPVANAVLLGAVLYLPANPSAEDVWDLPVAGAAAAAIFGYINVGIVLGLYKAGRRWGWVVPA